MKRRAFLKGLFAAPVGAAALKVLPEETKAEVADQHAEHLKAHVNAHEEWLDTLDPELYKTKWPVQRADGTWRMMEVGGKGLTRMKSDLGLESRRQRKRRLRRERGVT